MRRTPKKLVRGNCTNPLISKGERHHYSHFSEYGIKISQQPRREEIERRRRRKS